MVRSGTGPERLTMMMGNSLKFTSLMVYFSNPSGNSASALSIASRTSARIWVLFQPNSNSSATPAKFSAAVPVIFSSPSRSLSSVSIGLTRSFSLSSAEMPGKGTVMKSAGISISGSPSLGRLT